jgi:hypothetical protein
MKVNLDVIKRIYKKKLTTKNVKVSTKTSLNNILEIKKYLNTLVCPNCGKKECLLLINIEMGKYIWEAKVGCSKCLSKGILNSTGLSFNLNVNKLLQENQ